MDATYNLNGTFMPTMKRNVDLGGPDHYATPGWAVYALLDNELFDGPILEPACGEGDMARVLALTGRRIIPSDLYNRGYGVPGQDFLSSNGPSPSIITNPPFNSAGGFVATCVRRSAPKFALLLRLAFLEGRDRATNIYLPGPPTCPSRLYVFSDRLTFYPKGHLPKNGSKKRNGGTVAYAWFVWDREWEGEMVTRILRPGYRRRYLDFLDGKECPAWIDPSVARPEYLEYLRRDLQAVEGPMKRVRPGISEKSRIAAAN